MSHHWHHYLFSPVYVVTTHLKVPAPLALYQQVQESIKPDVLDVAVLRVWCFVKKLAAAQHVGTFINLLDCTNKFINRQN